MIETQAYTMENWKETVEAINSGEMVEVNEEVYWYFLEVLPPVFMNKKFKFIDGQIVRASFGFAEGAESIKVFWKEGGKYFCRQSTLINIWN